MEQAKQISCKIKAENYIKLKNIATSRGLKFMEFLASILDNHADKMKDEKK